jgi:hypothetical protein
MSSFATGIEAALLLVMTDDQNVHRYTVGLVANMAATKALRLIVVAQIVATTGEVVAAMFTTQSAS